MADFTGFFERGEYRGLVWTVMHWLACRLRVQRADGGEDFGVGVDL